MLPLRDSGFRLKQIATGKAVFDAELDTAVVTLVTVIGGALTKQVFHPHHYLVIRGIEQVGGGILALIEGIRALEIRVVDFGRAIANSGTVMVIPGMFVITDQAGQWHHLVIRINGITIRRHIDPTDANGQFVDRGTQYRSEIFYTTPEQKQLAEDFINLLEKENIFIPFYYYFYFIFILQNNKFFT